MNIEAKGRLLKFSAVALLIFLTGCNGEDEIGSCLFGVHSPEFDITVYDSNTEEKLCGTDYVGGFKVWNYSGACDYTFDAGVNSDTTDITVKLDGYSLHTEKNVQNPNLCDLDSKGSTFVVIHMSQE